MAVRRIELTPEQQAAILTPGNLLIRAGAGSGKTEVLARRFGALIGGDIPATPALNPASIAAITFTEKAALDMSERIASVVAERIAVESDPERRLMLTRAQRSLWLARISTIHAFCAGILRENAALAGLDPGFEVLDEYESQTFFERVALQTVVAAVRQGDPGARFLVAARGLRGSQIREGTIQIVQRIVTEANRRGQTLLSVIDCTRQAALRLDRADGVAILAQTLTGLIDNLCEVRAGGQAAVKINHLGQWWETVRGRVRSLTRAAPLDDLEILRELSSRLPRAQGSAKQYVAPIKLVVDKSKRKFGLGGDLIAAWGEYRAAGPALGVARLVAAVAAEFDRAKREEGVMTFDDLLVATRDLLTNHGEVAARYRRELQALLVDEYQDTNGLQDQIVQLLTVPGESDDQRAPQLFIVGDEKQSIYRFRGADVTVFNRSRSPQPQTLPLPDNRRSTPSILSFVNALGASMMQTAGVAALAYQIVWNEHHELRPRRSVEHDYPVEILVASYDGPEGNNGVTLSVREKRMREARAIVNLISAMIAAGDPVFDVETDACRPVRAGDIVVLLRAFSDIAIYERALDQGGIESYTVNGRGFYGRPEVVDLIELMASIAEPRDTIALAAALRSPLFGLSDQALLELSLADYEVGRPSALAGWFTSGSRRPDFSRIGDEATVANRGWDTLAELRRIRGRVALAELVERALALTDYESVVAGLPQGSQRVANLRKLVEIARHFDTRRFFTFEDFVRHLRRLTEEEPYEPQAQLLEETADVVRLMTIHQAKGLEFPIVILADVGRRPNPEVQPPLLDPENGLLISDTFGSGYDEIPNAALDRYRQRVKDEEAAEQLRVLYVALTRARDRLILSEGGDRQGWFATIRTFVSEANFQTFISENQPTKLIERDGVRILLRRPELSVIAPSEPLRSGTARDAEGARLIERRLNAVIDPLAELVVSPTALADFARCPRRYWLRHGLKLSTEGGEGSGGVALAMGSVAHRVLEHYQFEIDSSETELRRLTHVFGASAGLDADQCESIIRDLVKYAQLVNPDDLIIDREVPFMLNPAADFFLRGQIDAVVRIGNKIVVRDYKYATSADASHYRVQVECYALAAAAAFPDCEIGAEIVALRAPEVVEIELPAAEKLREKVIERAAALFESARAADYPKRPAMATECRSFGCEFVQTCWEDR